MWRLSLTRVPFAQQRHTAKSVTSHLALAATARNCEVPHSEVNGIRPSRDRPGRHGAGVTSVPHMHDERYEHTVGLARLGQE
jgi:hypothetical protein